MRILSVVLLTFIAASAPQAPGPPATIRGIVVHSGTLEPVAKAVVRLTRNGSVEPLVVSTGADGRFEFLNVAPGTYDLTAGRSGYLTTTFGQRGPSGTGRQVSIAAGAIIENIRLPMTLTGVISGRVFDDVGDPLANVPVQALKYSYVDGQRTLTPVKADQTNDLGEFRLFWLPPGQYYISAQPQDSRGAIVMIHDSSVGGRTLSFDSNGLPIDRANLGAQKPGEAYVPVYYPGTADPQSASRVEVRPGADIRGIDFALARVTTRKVRGTVIDGVTGQPAEVAMVQLVPRSNVGVTFRGSLDRRGTFEVSGVLPGAYFLFATARIGPRDDVKILGGRTSVDVGYADLDNITVTLHPAIDIGGSVTLEGPTEGFAANARPIIFLQGRRDTILNSLAQSYASFTNSTEFTFNNLIEGDYQIWWDKLPPGMYIKSVLFGPVDALTAGLHIDPRTTDRVHIVISANAGALDGVVRDNLRNVVPRARVVLVPDAARSQRADLYQSTSTDESGRFQLQGISPGDYFLFAWEDVENDLWREPEFIKRYESFGRPVRITENSRETTEVVATPSSF